MWAQKILYRVYNSNDEHYKTVNQKDKAKSEAQRLGVGSYYIRCKQTYHRSGDPKKFTWDDQHMVVRRCVNCTCRHLSDHKQTRCEMLATLEGKGTWYMSKHNKSEEE